MIQFTCAEDKKSSCCHYWIFTFLCFCCLKNQLLRFHTIKRLNKQLLPTYTVIQYSTFRSNKILNAKFWSLIMQRSQMHIQQRNLLHFDTYNHCMSTNFFWHQYHWGFYLNIWTINYFMYFCRNFLWKSFLMVSLMKRLGVLVSPRAWFLNTTSSSHLRQ